MNAETLYSAKNKQTLATDDGADQRWSCSKRTNFVQVARVESEAGGEPSPQFSTTILPGGKFGSLLISNL